MKTVLSVCLFASSAALLTGCHTEVSTNPATVPAVRAHVVASQSLDSAVYAQATGTVHAHESVVLSAQVVARVQKVVVREGDFVKAGQTLVVLDDSTLKASVDQAEAAVKAAQKQEAAVQSNADLAMSTLARYRKLQAEKSVSPQELDEVGRRAEASSAEVEAVKAQRAASLAQAQGAQAMLQFTRIRAPFAGIVTARMVDPGALASPGVPLLQIDSAGPLQLQVPVDESALSGMHTGMQVGVKIDGIPDADAHGTIQQMVPAADPASHTFLIKIDLPPTKNLRAGMYGTANIPTGKRPAIVAPRTAIVMRGSLACAYVVDEHGTAQLRYVTLGATQGGLVEILSGISGGEKLVDVPADRDLSGKRIEVQP